MVTYRSLKIRATSNFGWTIDMMALSWLINFDQIALGNQGSYLVDPASSHMLVSKIKPCMSKYKLLIL